MGALQTNFDGDGKPLHNTRVDSYGCFLPDLTGFTIYRHYGD